MAVQFVGARENERTRHLWKGPSGPVEISGVEAALSRFGDVPPGAGGDRWHVRKAGQSRLYIGTRLPPARMADEGSPMTPTPAGSVRLFRLTGIEVFLHWSWLVVAFYQIGERKDDYSSLTWNVAEYLALFLIVLLHEFGHSLACRQVGGRADQIVLWPLGGVAYIAPPQRPGAVLWSIVAGPLVNLVLAVPLAALWWFSDAQEWSATRPDVHGLVFSVFVINLALLVFNMLPIYPLDGGQTLRAVLWFFIGRARSLFVAVIIGFLGVAGLAAYAISVRSIWMGILAFFVFSMCRRGWAQAQALSEMDRTARRAGFSCPSCHVEPPMGAMWLCPECRTAFDTFQTRGECPHCRAQFATTQCLDCATSHPLEAWER